MTILDLLIIYLACGSPFGVYQLTRDDEKSDRWMAVAAFLVWPVFLVKFIYERLSPRAPTKKEQIDRIISDLEQLAFSDMEAASIFEFREAFDRYVGLAESLAQDEPSQGPMTELIGVSGRELDEATTECLNRRNYRKLTFHLTIARNEFLDLVRRVERDETKGPKAAALTLELADLIGDIDAKDQVIELGGATDNDQRPHTEGPWKPNISSASNLG